MRINYEEIFFFPPNVSIAVPIREPSKSKTEEGLGLTLLYDGVIELNP